MTRVVCVDDGSLGFGTSSNRGEYVTEKQIKKRIADSIDVDHYLSLGMSERYMYVMAKVDDMRKVIAKEEVNAAHQKVLVNKSRKFVGVDLTLL